MSLPRVAPYSIPESGQLPAPRVDWRPQRARAALLVHDLQHYFVDVFDLQASPMAEALAHIDALARHCRALGIPVIYTAQPGEQTRAQRGLLQDWWGDGIVARPEAAAILQAVAPQAGDHVLDKHRYSGLRGTELESILQREGRDQLMICGVYAHIGCLATALDAFMQDIQPFFVADAMGDLSATEHRMAIDFVARRCGIPIATGDLLAALSSDAPAAQIALPAIAAVRAQVAELLECDPAEIDDRADLTLDHGLDSVRLMSLVERWRAAGFEVGFVELAEAANVVAWSELLDARAPVEQA